jgi:uncharacterized protein (TIGR03435 family)
MNALSIAGLIAVSMMSATAQSVFEVASIRLRPRLAPRTLSSTGRLSISGTSVTGTMSVWDLMQYAYSMMASQRGPVPAWVTTERWDIRAKAPGSNEVTAEQVKAMIRTLLADRFQLKLREESREASTYQLIESVGGSKLRSVTDSSVPSRRVARSDGVMEWAEGSQTMRSLIGLLSGFTDRPILNMTAIQDTASVVFALRFVPDRLLTAPNGPSGPSVYKAVEEQLGLKLEAAKVPRPYFVVERVEKPSEN